MKNKKLLSILISSLMLLPLVACTPKDPIDDPVEPVEPTEHTHSFGEWTVTKEAGNYSMGEKERVCSCGEKEVEKIPATVWSWGQYSSSITGKSTLNLVSEKLEAKKGMTYDVEECDTLMDALVLAVTEENMAKLEELDEELGTYIDNLIECASVNQVFFYATGDEQYQTLQDGARDTRVHLIDRLVDDLYPVAAEKNDTIKMYVFDTTDPVEIAEIIAEGQDSAAANALSVELSKLEDEAEQKISDASSYSEITSIAAEYYLKEAALIWELSEPKGQTPSEYLNGLFYSRQYERSEIKKVLDFVVEYIAPIFPSAWNNFNNGKKPDGLDTNFYKNLANKNFIVEYNGKCPGEYFDDYAQYVGGDYLQVYTDLWTDGYYYFTNGRNSMGTAYIDDVTDYCIAYFSSSNQKVDTIVHEFGHYFAESQRLDLDFYDSYDILETHSQGNEACFYNYMKTVNASATTTYYGDNAFLNFIATIVCSSSLVDVEEYCFSNKDLINEWLHGDQAKAKRMVNSYAQSNVNKYFNGVSGLNSNYWAYGCLSPVYYASYVTSACCSAALYAMELDDAIAAYLNFVTDFEDKDEIARWADSGMPSPFAKECFEYLNSELTRISEAYQK